MSSDPYFPDDFLNCEAESAVDVLLLRLDTAALGLRETLTQKEVD